MAKVRLQCAELTILLDILITTVRQMMKVSSGELNRHRQSRRARSDQTGSINSDTTAHKSQHLASPYMR